MTDTTKYTVTIEVEADATGPAQAIRQALDWARDTQSGPGVVTVRAGDLSPLRAAELFTGPVTTPSPVFELPRSYKLDALARKARNFADKWRAEGVAPTDLRAVSGMLTSRARVMTGVAKDLEALTAEPGPSCQKPALRAMVYRWRQVASKLGSTDVAFDTVKAAKLCAEIKRLHHCADDLEALTNDI